MGALREEIEGEALLLGIESRIHREDRGGGRRHIVRGQPPSPARTSFAWQLAVGPALARVTSVEMDGTTVRVYPMGWNVKAVLRPPTGGHNVA